MAFKFAYWDNQAPLDGAWYLGNAAVAYKSNGLGMESLKMTIAKLMGMHSGRGLDKMIGRASIGGVRTASTRKFSFYV